MSRPDLIKCSRCKALVEAPDSADHDQWHERLVNLLHTLDITKTMKEPVLGAASTFEL